jgi:hypothetical protein
VWVQLWQDSTDLSPDDPSVQNCNGLGISSLQLSGTTVAKPSRQHALVVDASTGAAVIYDGAGPSACAVYAAPFAFPATRTDSVPWKALGGARVRVALPPCAVVSGGSREKQTWQTRASRGFEACSGSATSKVMTGWSGLLSGHAPVGTLCAQIAQGVPLTRPSVCIN